MSETRKTTTIEEIEAPSREPMISMADALMAGGWLAYHGTRLAVKGAIAGTKLACQGGKAVASTIRNARRQATFPEISRTVEKSGSAREAVVALANGMQLEVPQHASKALSAKLASLVSRNDKAGVATVARELVAGKQQRLQAQLMPLVTESCKAIGFMPESLVQSNGIITATRKGTRQTLTIEVAKTRDGAVQIHYDASGFEGGECVRAIDAHQEELRKRGVQSGVQERRIKPRPRVKIAQPARIRCRY